MIPSTAILIQDSRKAEGLQREHTRRIVVENIHEIYRTTYCTAGFSPASRAPARFISAVRAGLGAVVMNLGSSSILRAK